MRDLASLPVLKRYWLAKTSGIPFRYHGWELSDIESQMGSLDEQLGSWMKMVLNGDVLMKSGALNSTGVGLLFDGKPGRGKTTHAVTMMNEFIYQLPDNPAEAQKILHIKPADYNIHFRPVYYMTFTTLLSKKKAMFDVSSEERRYLHEEMEGFYGRAKDDSLNVRILLLDDLGKEYGSKYDDFSFDDIIRARYDNGLPTILTTNRERETWGANYSEAMESFAHEAFWRIKLDGEDIRSEGLKNGR